MPTTAEGETLFAGKTGDTYGPYTVGFGRRLVPGGPVVPVDVTGWLARCEARTLPAGQFGSRVVAVLTSGGPDAGGKWYLAASAAAMLAVPGGRYYFDFEVTLPGGVVKTRFAGFWTVTDDVTRPGV